VAVGLQGDDTWLPVILRPILFDVSGSRGQIRKPKSVLGVSSPGLQSIATEVGVPEVVAAVAAPAKNMTRTAGTRRNKAVGGHRRFLVLTRKRFLDSVAMRRVIVVIGGSSFRRSRKCSLNMVPLVANEFRLRGAKPHRLGGPRYDN
jgi:hypothetical protein